MDTFNRTIVELKQACALDVDGRHAPFNRTIVELKPAGWLLILVIRNAFNRTIVELKHLVALRGDGVIHYF